MAVRVGCLQELLDGHAQLLGSEVLVLANLQVDLRDAALALWPIQVSHHCAGTLHAATT